MQTPKMPESVVSFLGSADPGADLFGVAVRHTITLWAQANDSWEHGVAFDTEHLPYRHVVRFKDAAEGSSHPIGEGDSLVNAAKDFIRKCWADIDRKTDALRVAADAKNAADDAARAMRDAAE